jgi:hypothetical protein
VVTSNKCLQEHLQTHPLYQDENGIDCVGQMIEGTYNSPSYRFYGSLFHFYLMMLGHMMDPYHKQGVSAQQTPVRKTIHTIRELRQLVHFPRLKLL